VGLVDVKIGIAGANVHHKAVLAQNFEHLILLGNDFMKLIGLVLDIQANKMWLRSRPDLTYPISSDLINVGRIDIPLLSTQLRTIPPFHIAFVQAKTPSFISSDDWQASITGIRRHVVAANSLVRVKNQCCLLQVANCSSKVQVIYPGQYLAVADYYDNDIDEVTRVLSSTSLSPHNFDLSYQNNRSIAFDKSHVNHHQSCFTIAYPELQNHDGDMPLLYCNNSSCISSVCSSILPCHMNSSNSTITKTFASLIDDNHMQNISNLNSEPNLDILDSKLSDIIPPRAQSSTIYALYSNVPSVESLEDHKTPSTTDSFEFLTGLDLTDSDITSSQTEQLKAILVKYHQCFENKLGRTSLVQHHIDTGNTKPIKLRPYRVSPYRKAVISHEITQMLDAGIIEPCIGPYAAPITLQPKKDGSLRFCIDYRELNSVTIRDVYPIPRIDDTLDQLQHAKYFSTMDLRSGFWQIELDPISRDKTAFISHAGLYRFRVMPFGLTNAPATFQRLMI
jgi:hypothetical protein